jgi:AcrR family transcriptional regulator
MSAVSPPSREEAKRIAVFEAAATVFAQYGFRRTTMNDIAEAAAISRPALYLMFENKEHLFAELATFRLEQAAGAAEQALASASPLTERFLEAVLVFEQIFYEPIADSPHGAELMDTNISLKNERMTDRLEKLMTALVAELNKAEKAGEIQFSSAPGTPREFVELLFTSIGGIKKKATSGADFRKQVRQLTEIFLDTLKC